MKSIEVHPICSGAVLTENYVITSAVCISLYNASNYYVLLGDYNIKDMYDGQERFEVAEIKIHPGFDLSIQGYPNDIALLRLSTSVKFNVKIEQICLPGYSGNVLCIFFHYILWLKCKPSES